MLTILEIIGGIALAILAAYGILRLLNKNAAANWLHLGRTKIDSTGEYAKGIDPANQMRLAAKDSLEELKNTDEALIKTKALITRLKRQQENNQKTKTTLQHKIKELLTKGTPENDPQITEKLKRIIGLDKDIEENQKQITLNQELYDTTNKNANKAQQKLTNTIQRADQLKIQLELGHQSQKTQELLDKYNPHNLNQKLTKLNEYEQAAQQQLDELAAAQQLRKDRHQEQEDDDEPLPTELTDTLNKIKNQ